MRPKGHLEQSLEESKGAGIDNPRKLKWKPLICALECWTEKTEAYSPKNLLLQRRVKMIRIIAATTTGSTAVLRDSEGTGTAAPD